MEGTQMSDLGKIVSTAAPILSNVLNAMLPGSGLVINGLMTLFGAKDNEDLIAKINADPEAALKLKTFELEHKFDLEQIQAGDVSNARNREIEVTKATGHSDKTVATLAYVFVGGFFLYSFCLFFVHIDTSVHDIVLLLAGQISVLAINVGNYFFGGMFKSKTSLNTSKPEVVLSPPTQTR